LRELPRKPFCYGTTVGPIRMFQPTTYNEINRGHQLDDDPTDFLSQPFPQ
jgi:hypothetical protein